MQAEYDAHFARLIQAPRLAVLLRAMTEQDVANVAAVLGRVAASHSCNLTKTME